LSFNATSGVLSSPSALKPARRKAFPKRLIGECQPRGAVFVNLRQACQREMNVRKAFVAPRPLLRSAAQILDHLGRNTLAESSCEQSQYALFLAANRKL
jgi:hypothetical protein